nr:unnamed protein product [Spirometra erinaceieuropaei]
MDQLSLATEHCANSGHTFALQSAEILGRGNDRVTRETIEAWHTGTNSINRCVTLPEAYQTLRTQFREQRSKRGLRGEWNSITAGSMGDTNAAALQLGSGEGAIVTTVATPTYPEGAKTDDCSNINGPAEGASVTATYSAGAVASGHFSAASTHTAAEAEKLQELASLWHFFLVNGYPRSFVNKCLFQRHTKTDGEANQKPEVLRVLPYMTNVSEATERMLRPLNVGVGHRPEATIRRLVMQPKGRLLPEDMSGVIYRVNCLDCQANYCGMINKRLKTRMHEHTLAVKRKDARSHVAMRSLENDHRFDFDGAQVLGRAENRLAREIIEAWQTDANSINRSVDLAAPYEATKHHIRTRGGPMTI